MTGPDGLKPGRGRGGQDPEAQEESFFPELLEPKRRIDRALWWRF